VDETRRDESDNPVPPELPPADSAHVVHESIVVGADAVEQRRTHRLFRYPAKFHAPAVDLLLRRYTTPGQTVLDPFCGSGTLMVEAMSLNRFSIGSDVDPLAVAISKAKTRKYNIPDLESALTDLHERLSVIERDPKEYERLKYADLDDSDFVRQSKGLWVPQIPKLNHWFRRYVSIDLARIRAEIVASECEERTRDFLMLVFASIIRNASNADPVPVSGLEVTSHMLRKDAEGRLVNPFALFRTKSKRSLADVKQFTATLSADFEEPLVLNRDATTLKLSRMVDAVLTSPPYHNAVDYYRRHQLEMFWLDLTTTQADRLDLLPRYIGKARIAQSHPVFRSTWDPTPTAKHWEETMRATSETRARDFRAYMVSMAKVFRRLGDVLEEGSPAIFVVGRSDWNGASIPTDQLFVEVASEWFELSEHLTYPVKNRYMSYSRHNGANIDLEHVVVFNRKSGTATERSTLSPKP
jgi:tRNA G10  N-methylase Trm11